MTPIKLFFGSNPKMKSDARCRPLSASGRHLASAQPQRDASLSRKPLIQPGIRTAYGQSMFQENI
jgi:hypothetical protein